MNEDRYDYGYEMPLNAPTMPVPVIIDTLNGKQLNMTDSEFYWFLKLLNHKGIITTTDIINNEIKCKEVLYE